MVHKPFAPEKSPSHRPARMAQRLKEELSTLIPGEIKDPRVQNLGYVTITSVTVAKDMKSATIQFALLSDESRGKEIETVLNAASGFLRGELRHALGTKVTPELTFKYDKGLKNAIDVDKLFQQIAKEREERGPIEETPETLAAAAKAAAKKAEDES